MLPHNSQKLMEPEEKKLRGHIVTEVALIDELVSRYPKRVARSVYNLLMCQISAHGNE